LSEFLWFPLDMSVIMFCSYSFDTVFN